MKELLEFMVKSIVSNKEAVEIKEIEDETEVVMEVKVSSEDLGKVIGKGGKVAQSIRAIIKTASNGMQKKYFVKILD